MSINELKSEIQKALDNVPEFVLEDVLTLLKKAQSQPNDRVALANHLRKILAEDNNLLDRLAK
jgi:hypothetical protein